MLLLLLFSHDLPHVKRSLDASGPISIAIVEIVLIKSTCRPSHVPVHMSRG